MLNLTCVYCPLLCQLPKQLQECDRRTQARRSWIGHPEQSPAWNDQPLDDSEAIQRASQLLHASRMTLVTGAWGNIASSRAILEFTQRHNGVIDLWQSDEAMAVALALQQGGTYQTTFNQIRTQARPLILLGDDRLLDDYPWLASRLAPINPSSAELWLLGNWSDRAYNTFAQHGWNVHRYKSRLASLIDGLMAWLNGVAHQDRSIQCPFDVVWSNRHLEGVEDVASWNRRFFRWLSDWNDQHATDPPCMALPLGSITSTFLQTATWLTGFPGRMRYHQERSSWDYQPERYRSQSLTKLATGPVGSVQAVQLVVWIDEVVPPTPIPDLQVPTIVCAPWRPRVEERTAAHADRLFLPCFVPGIDFEAMLVRADQSGLLKVHDPVAGRVASGRPLADWLAEL